MITKDTKDNALYFNITLGQRLLLFLCATVICFLIGSFLTGFIVHFKGATPVTMRISAVLQDVIVFIAPAILTAVIVTRLPARLLAIDLKPKFMPSLLPCLVLLCAMPAMNWLVLWNESIAMPESLSGLEQWMREAEQNAQDSIAILLGNGSVGSLILSILIVGILAGLSEELFFRGAFQRLLSTGGLNHHATIWIVAFVFSATHLQFYGFFGRLVLGAYFGYLLYWSRCLWIPVIVHVFNNTLYILGNYASEKTANDTDINNFGADNTSLIVVSIVLTVIGLLWLRKFYLADKENSAVKS